MNHNSYKVGSLNGSPLYVNGTWPSSIHGNFSSGTVSNSTDSEQSDDLEKEYLQASIRALHKEVEQLRAITSEQDERIQELALAIEEIRRPKTRHPVFGDVGYHQER